MRKFLLSFSLAISFISLVFLAFNPHIVVNIQNGFGSDDRQDDVFEISESDIKEDGENSIPEKEDADIKNETAETTQEIEEEIKAEQALEK